MSTQSWAVVATVDEPTPLVLTFAAYHLTCGAKEVHLYFDSPDREAEAALAGLPGLHIVTSDDAHWAEARGGVRPALPTSRQIANVNHAYARTGADWLLHIDADEFLRDPAALTARMATTPDNVVFIQLGVIERVRLVGAPNLGLFDGLFRAPREDSDSWTPEVYGRFSKFLGRGVAGHHAGKALVRTGLTGLRQLIHYPKFTDSDAFPPFRQMPAQLLHFDGITPLHYAAKLLRRFDEPAFKPTHDKHGRGAQMRFLRNNRGKRRPLENFTLGLLYVTPDQADRLEALGVLARLAFDPAPALAVLNIDADLTCTSFDARLRDRMPELINTIALSG
jgi:Glycosyl transferase family 2